MPDTLHGEEGGRQRVALEGSRRDLCRSSFQMDCDRGAFGALGIRVSQALSRTQMHLVPGPTPGLHLLRTQGIGRCRMWKAAGAGAVR